MYLFCLAFTEFLEFVGCLFINFEIFIISYNTAFALFTVSFWDSSYTPGRHFHNVPHYLYTSPYPQHCLLVFLSASVWIFY